MFGSKTVFSLLTVFSACFGAIDIKKYLKVCDRNSIDVNDCMTDAVQKGIAVMIHGIPELGVPPIDPYLQKEFKVEYKNNQVAQKDYAEMDDIEEILRYLPEFDSKKDWHYSL